jgi:dipeptidyl aminopeptidase/acylaminoacyl peptidase
VARTADGRDLVFSWSGHFGLSRLSRISAKADPQRDQFDALPFGEQATALSISPSGKVVYSAQFRDTAFFEASPAEGSYALLAGAGFSSTFEEDTPDCSADGRRVAFASTRSGVQEIWVANRDGSQPLEVTSMGGSVSANPRWSPRDGRTIVFDSRREGSGDLYTLVPDTRELHRLTTDSSDEIEPRWSRDGRWIYFGSNRSGRYQVWRISADGGALKQITQGGGSTASESADGRYLYYAKTFFSPTEIWRVPVDGGAEEFVVAGLSYSLNFVVAEHGIYLVTGQPDVERASIDYFEFATRRRTTIVDVQKRWWNGLALCGDTSLIFPLVDSAGSNLMLVERFR